MQTQPTINEGSKVRLYSGFEGVIIQKKQCDDVPNCFQRTGGFMIIVECQKKKERHHTYINMVKEVLD